MGKKLTIEKLQALHQEGKAEPIEWSSDGYYSQMGNSYHSMRCPVCGDGHIVYPWSLAGSGKKCENKECETVFFSGGRGLTLIKAIKL